MVRSLDESESRSITALDEILRALFFMCKFIEESDSVKGEKHEKPEKAKEESASASVKKRQQSSTDVESAAVKSENAAALSVVLTPKYEAAFALCIKIFLTFCFTGEAVVNSKLFRSYSLLRSELQALMLKVQQQLQIDANALLSAVGSSGAAMPDAAAKSKADKRKSKLASMSALELAELLRSTLVDKGGKATSMAVEDDDEDATENRVALIMKTKPEVKDALTDYMTNIMILPLALHDAPRKVLEELATSATSSSCQKDLVDVISIVKKYVDTCVPLTWIMFASDTAELYFERGYWPENTDKAGHGVRFQCITQTDSKTSKD